jgi:hypothetical protein
MRLWAGVWQSQAPDGRRRFEYTLRVCTHHVELWLCVGPPWYPEVSQRGTGGAASQCNCAPHLASTAPHLHMVMC